ncbi:MAG: hypothetical protein JSS18_15700 [Proteobacteria bacterium]|uniref:PhaM family polyhydroxyalkanoate granule multifunctional regulatory protein n=1 Tax=Ottowia sp. TaxID=1898956 RepID=UPI001DD4D7B2|nr:PhaM family polyhydroxyalkanoate granule multifunctional regulatory protein [Ottowia sp.]MBS0403909.1 hypothetical protein [Pseudomonadota bacterium]
MSEQTPFAFGKLIPGFEFLQQLTAGNAGGAAATGLSHWVAPTVNVEELEQRISELKTVQFWLEQNLLALKATVQALEVQKMTLLTLRGMNLSMAEVAQAFTMPPAAPSTAAPAPASEGGSGWPYADKSAAAPAPAPEAEPAEPDEPKAAAPAKAPRRPAAAKAPAAAAPAGAGVTDPIQWWGALTQQFQQIATQTLREAARAMPAAEPADLAPADAPAAAPKPAAPARKAAATKRKKAARKTPAPKAAAKAPAPKPRSLLGWPLPTPPEKS